MRAETAAREDARQSIFLVTAPGLESVAARELSGLGLSGEVEEGGVSLAGDHRTLYALNLRLRTASRILVRVAEFRARTFFELERHAARLPWKSFLGGGRPVRLRVTSRKSKLYHQRAIEQRLVAAVGAEAATGRGEGEEEEAEGAAEQLFVVRFLYDRCVISADSSGALLHRRGYRQALGRAPLRETLAAAMLTASGWHGQAPLLDPFCGSGTIPIEAALIARCIVPGLASGGQRPRSYAFLSWPDADHPLFEKLVDDCREEVLPRSPVRVVGSDRDAGAAAAAVANAERAGVAEDVEFSVRPLSAAEAPGEGGWVVTNPPYGVRVGDSRALRDLYAALGREAPRLAPGGKLVLLSADRQLEKQLRRPLRELFATRNGGIAVRGMES